MKKNREFSAEAEQVRDWFLKSVTFEDEPYIMDLEQAAAVADQSKNALVIARAGSGKTRTLVAKIIHLVAKCNVAPEDIMAFVFNANAATEINERLGQMLVDGKPVLKKPKIASTFHAFSRHVVYDLADGRELCGDILAGEKDDFVFFVVQELLKLPDWEAKIRQFIRGPETSPAANSKKSSGLKSRLQKLSSPKSHKSKSLDPTSQDEAPESNLSTKNRKAKSSKSADSANSARDLADTPEPLLGNPDDPDFQKPLTLPELRRFAGAMSQFINRAQQKFLGSDQSLADHLKSYQTNHKILPREQLFLELGAECYRRYHWRLLDESAHFPDFRAFRTDFNLLVSWAAQIIASRRPETDALLASKKYLLIDEYQDFSGLFLSAVKAIRSVATDAKLFAVGDDWQAINRFAGSDVDYFKNFATYFPDDTKLLDISTNYRCHYQIVDTARDFMKKAMREKGNFEAFSKKAGEIFLVDPSRTPLGFSLVDWDDRVSPTDKLYKKFVQSLMKDPPKEDTVRYIKTLVEIIKENPSAKEILFLHRNNETNLQNLNLDVLQKRLPALLRQLGLTNFQTPSKPRPGQSPKSPSVANPQSSAKSVATQSIRFMTMHKSKGLESDVVVLLEIDDGIIPRVHPDTYLYNFFGETEDIVLDDQKRLFYVAMTRAKKRLYIIHKPAAKRSEDGFIQFLGRGPQKWHDDD